MLLLAASLAAPAYFHLPVKAATVAQDHKIKWKGYTWMVRSGSGGPGPNTWDPANVSIDSKGYLHLKISQTATGWSCAEIDGPKLGFGTYQWTVEGRVDAMDRNVVLGLFGYQGPDGVHEIDVEFARWGKQENDNGNWTVYPDSGKNIGSKTFPFNLEGGESTSRYKWSSTGVEYWFMTGFQPIKKVSNLVTTWNYQPADSKTNITQTPMPLDLNLWLFQGHAPTDGKPVEIVIHDFKKI